MLEGEPETITSDEETRAANYLEDVVQPQIECSVEGLAFLHELWPCVQDDPQIDGNHAEQSRERSHMDVELHRVGWKGGKVTETLTAKTSLDSPQVRFILSPSLLSTD